MVVVGAALLAAGSDNLYRKLLVGERSRSGGGDHRI